MTHLRKISASFQSTEIDGELVMIHGETGKFFALKDVGLHVWNALDDETDLAVICGNLEQAYPVGAEECNQSVQAFADHLVKVGFAEYF